MVNYFKIFFFVTAIILLTFYNQSSHLNLNSKFWKLVGRGLLLLLAIEFLIFAFQK